MVNTNEIKERIRDSRSLIEKSHGYYSDTPSKKELLIAILENQITILESFLEN